MAVEVLHEKREGLLRKYREVGRDVVWPWWDGSHYSEYDGIGKIVLLRTLGGEVTVFPEALQGRIHVKNAEGKKHVDPSQVSLSTRIGELNVLTPSLSITNKKAGRRITLRLIQNPEQEPPMEDISIGSKPKGPEPTLSAAVALKIPK